MREAGTKGQRAAGEPMAKEAGTSPMKGEKDFKAISPLKSGTQKHPNKRPQPLTLKAI